MAWLQGVEAVVFDAVGTLLHADPPVAEVYHLTGWQYGSQYSRSAVAERLRVAFAASEAGEGLVRSATSEAHERARWQAVVAAVFDDVPAAGGPLFDSLWRHFAAAENWQLYPDVEAVIDELASRGIRLAIASNFDRRLHSIVQQIRPLARCERCFVSSEVGFPKPDRRFFQAIEQSLGLPPEHLLLVGDDWTNDILGARAAGWRAMWLARKEATSPEPHVRSLLELLAGPASTQQ
jgi:putative hydrolase of the HAD superfamily